MASEPWTATATLAAALLLALGSPARAAEPAGSDPPNPEVATVGELQLFPPGDVYAPYLADPHRIGFAARMLSVSRVGIADSGSGRFDLKAGGALGLLGRRPREAGKRSWQLSLVVGFDAQFDRDHSLDSIGWDGNYGLMWTTTRGGLGFKTGILHTSAHVGDELEERTGRRRLGYTREELVAGVDRRFGRWRAYVEGGWGYVLRNRELQQPGRLQTGLEIEVPKALWKGRLGWYAAADVSATEERDWRLDTAIQAGLALPSGGRTWRLGLELYDGRPPLGEFFQDTERWLALGIWMDP